MEKMVTSSPDHSDLVLHRPAYLSSYRSQGKAALNTCGRRAVRTANELFDLLDKDWGQKTSQEIIISGKFWRIHLLDDAHYVPASQREFNTFLNVLELTHCHSKVFSYTQVVIPDNRSESTPAIRIANPMPVSEAHAYLDAFTNDIYHQIRIEVKREGKEWTFPNNDGVIVSLKPFDIGPRDLSLRWVDANGVVKQEPDRGLFINWHEEISTQWPFWLHESCVSESFEHVHKKALKYLHGSKNHVAIISILKMEKSKSRSGKLTGWRVDLSIWKVEREKSDNGKYRPVAVRILDRVEVYPNKPEPPLKLTIFKQDLVTFHRNKKEALTDTKLEIVLDEVHEIAEMAVKSQLNKEMDLPSSSLDPNQIGPSSPLESVAHGSNASYQDEEGSEKAASQRENISLRRRQNVRETAFSATDGDSQDTVTLPTINASQDTLHSPTNNASQSTLPFPTNNSSQGDATLLIKGNSQNTLGGEPDVYKQEVPPKGSKT